MISNLNELKEVNFITKKIINKHNLSNQLSIGMMFEVPSVFINPEPYLQEINFASIGTNDLVQYLYGVDRNNSHVTHLYNQDDQAVYDLIGRLIKNAHEIGKEVSLCGEINYDTQFLEHIIELGINKISIAPIGVAKLIKKIKCMNF